MIIFKNKLTGQIVGTIRGRIHSEAQLKIWMGDPETTERIIIDWEVVKQIPTTQEVEAFETIGVQDGEDVYRRVVKTVKKMKSIWEPKHSQRALLKDLESGKKKIRDYMWKDDKLVRNTKVRRHFTMPINTRTPEEIEKLKSKVKDDSN